MGRTGITFAEAISKSISKSIASLLMVAAVSALVAPTLLQAQENSHSRIAGTVKDLRGANVNGAEVSLIHPQQAVLRTARTDASGNFTLDNITPGSYEINVTVSGFGSYRSAVRLRAGETKGLSVVLQVNPLIEEVTVTAEAGLVTDARSIAQPVNIIRQEEIVNRATEVVAQVVDEEPGVNLQRTSPSLSAVFVRGLTGRNVAVFVDGVRYTTSAQRGGVGTFFSLIEPSSLETVEVLRGPQSSQYGSDVLGGVVNFVSRAPVYGN